MHRTPTGKVLITNYGQGPGMPPNTCYSPTVWKMQMVVTWLSEGA
jgi:hypothetical protein